MKLKCTNETCGKTVALVSETGLLRITMKGRRVVVTGTEYSTVVSCSFCRHDNVITVEASKLIKDGLKLEPEDTPEDNPTVPIEKPDDENEEN
jgi:hypothetical protein